MMASLGVFGACDVPALLMEMNQSWAGGVERRMVYVCQSEVWCQ